MSFRCVGNQPGQQHGMQGEHCILISFSQPLLYVQEPYDAHCFLPFLQLDLSFAMILYLFHMYTTRIRHLCNA